MAFAQENRWAAKPRTATALKLVIHVVPFVVSVLTARLAQALIRGVAPELSWLLTALLAVLAAAAALVGSGRLMRRLLPLALLLKLSLLFPDQVPSRFGVALRSASPGRLARQLESADAEEATVAERVLALVAALASHDRRTRGHSERVRALTMLIADQVGIVGEDRDKLEWASLMHDLGKLDVPTGILNKKGRPSQEEWDVLRQHPAGGPGYAAGLAEWLGPSIHAMDQHHERYDGTGYPKGIVAEDITLSGRIVSVADAFEVMTATRSYKTPMTTQAARVELVACAGTHFDPNIVRSFMQVSVGDIHRALGPASWLSSLPFVGPATQAIGATGSGLLLGGSAAPALAAAAALTLLTPAPWSITEDPPPDTIATVAIPAADQGDSSEENGLRDDAAPAQGGGVGSTTDGEPRLEPEVPDHEPDVVVPEVDEVVDEVVEEILDGVIEQVEDLTRVIPGDVGDDLSGVLDEALESRPAVAEQDVEEVVEPVVTAVHDESAPTTGEVAETLGVDAEPPGLPIEIPGALG